MSPERVSVGEEGQGMHLSVYNVKGLTRACWP